MSTAASMFLREKGIGSGTNITTMRVIELLEEFAQRTRRKDKEEARLSRLRDNFASSALQGLCANDGFPGDQTIHAKAAYAYADAMMAERSKKP